MIIINKKQPHRKKQLFQFNLLSGRWAALL
jgi:hypothetical protein